MVSCHHYGIKINIIVMTGYDVKSNASVNQIDLLKHNFNLW